MDTPKAYLSVRGQGIRVGRKENACPGEEQSGRWSASHRSPEQEEDAVLLGLRWRRKLRGKGPLPHCHPRYLKGILYACLQAPALAPAYEQTGCGGTCGWSV